VERLCADGGATSAGKPENALVNPLEDGAGEGVGSGRAGLNAGCSRCASHDGRSWKSGVNRVTTIATPSTSVTSTIELRSSGRSESMLPRIRLFSSGGAMSSRWTRTAR
jgi:hypothetical protein